MMHNAIRNIPTDNKQHPTKSTKHLYNADSTPQTLVQHCINVIQKFCVYWDSMITCRMHVTL